ncbi:MAG: DNA polymerase IV [Psychrobium sp.]
MAQRKIIHVDMDCFYAAVEMRDNPALAHQAVAVGGSRDRRGVISTCNYKAREFGVRSAMSTAMALKLCPSLVLMPSRMNVYIDVSQQIKTIFHRYTDLVEPLSLDEAYLDVSECKAFQGSASLIAEQIRQEIFQTTGLTASAGVAPNKFLAKIASDLNKPNGQYVIPPSDVDDFSAQLALKKISGIGKVTAEKLENYGLIYGEDIRRAKPEFLQRHFGKLADVLLARCYGIDDSLVKNNRIRKSVGVERTLVQDITTFEDCIAELERLKLMLNERYQRTKKMPIHKQGVKLKFNDFQSTTVEQTVDVFDERLYRNLLKEAFERRDNRAIRLVGINVGVREEQELIQDNAIDVPQLTLFDN